MLPLNPHYIVDRMRVFKSVRNGDAFLYRTDIEDH